MPIKILMPALSPTMEHGNLAKWVKKEGDTIKAGEVIAEIETDKATMEVEAVDEGTLAKILVQEGAQDVPVNSLIAVIIEEDEDSKAVEAFIAENNNQEKVAEEETKNSVGISNNIEEVVDTSNDIATENDSISPINNDVITKAISNKRIFASPLAKRIAKNEGLSLNNLPGSGPHGRIIKKDVLEAIKNNQIVSGQINRCSEEYKLIPNNNMRKVIAKRLVQSKQTVPHFYLSIDCVMDDLITARMNINQDAQDKGQKISVNDFVILATAKALKDVPSANASWEQDNIKIYNNIDVSVAVAIDGGLITPVIRNAKQKNKPENYFSRDEKPSKTSKRK